MNDVGRRQVRMAWALAKSNVREAGEPLRAAAYWLRALPRAAWCALTGWHRWTEWRESTTPFVPRETRYCRRCGAYDYRGGWPAIRVEAGSMFAWREDEA